MGKVKFRGTTCVAESTYQRKLLLVAMTTNFILTSPMSYSWWFVKMVTYHSDQT